MSVNYLFNAAGVGAHFSGFAPFTLFPDGLHEHVVLTSTLLFPDGPYEHVV